MSYPHNTAHATGSDSLNGSHHGGEKTYADKPAAETYAAGDYGGEAIEPREEETHRSLKPRQISMIAIGGAIGEWRGRERGRGRGQRLTRRYRSRYRLWFVARAFRTRVPLHRLCHHGRRVLFRHDVAR
jgi:hypothetical protein